MKNQQVLKIYAINILAAVKSTHSALQKKPNVEIAPLMPNRSNAMRRNTSVKPVKIS